VGGEGVQSGGAGGRHRQRQAGVAVPVPGRRGVGRVGLEVAAPQRPALVAVGLEEANRLPGDVALDVALGGERGGAGVVVAVPHPHRVRPVRVGALQSRGVAAVAPRSGHARGGVAAGLRLEREVVGDVPAGGEAAVPVGAQEVHLAHRPGGQPGVGRQVAEGAPRGPGGAGVAGRPAGARVAPGEQALPGGDAERGGGIGPAEGGAPRRQGVQVRRLHPGVARPAPGRGAVLVGHQHQDVAHGVAPAPAGGRRHPATGAGPAGLI
jgi:hypothetical protein